MSVPKVAKHLFDPGINRHIFVMADGIVLQADHDFVIACGTKEVFQEKMESLYEQVRAASGGTDEPFSSNLPPIGPSGAAQVGAAQDESGGIGRTYRSSPTGSDEIHVTGTDQFGTVSDVGG